MRPNQTATGGRHGTCSRTHRIRLRWLASQPGRFVDRKGAMACAAMARIARRAMAQARESSSRGSSWLPTRFDAGCWDGAAFEQPTVQRSDPRRLAVDTSSRFGSGGRAFRPLSADSEATHSVESRCTAGPLLLGGRAEDVRAQLVAGDAGFAFDGQAMMSRHRPTPGNPLPHQSWLNSNNLSERALAADLFYRNSNWAVHGRTIALLSLCGNSAARGIRRTA